MVAAALAGRLYGPTAVPGRTQRWGRWPTHPGVRIVLVMPTTRQDPTTTHVHTHDDEPCAPDPTETYECAAHGAQVVEVYV